MRSRGDAPLARASGAPNCGEMLSGPTFRNLAAIAAKPFAGPGEGDGPLAPPGEFGEPSWYDRPNKGLG